MALMSNVILGAGFPGNEPSDEGKIIGVKNDEYVAFPFIATINLTKDDSDLVTDKTAGEILELAEAGAILACRYAMEEGKVYQMPVLGIELAEGTYTLTVIGSSDSMTGTSAAADSPIVFSGS